MIAGLFKVQLEGIIEGLIGGGGNSPVVAFFAVDEQRHVRRNLAPRGATGADGDSVVPLGRDFELSAGATVGVEMVSAFVASAGAIELAAGNGDGGNFHRLGVQRLVERDAGSFEEAFEVGGGEGQDVADVVKTVAGVIGRQQFADINRQRQ